MDGNKLKNTLEPLFYIIQPGNRGKVIAQNMQEIYHSKGSIKEEEENKLKEEYKTQEVEAVKNDYQEDLQIEETLQENIGIVTEDEGELQIEETFEEYTDIISKDSLIKVKTSKDQEELNLDENKEVQVERDILKDDLRMKLIRLARYPAVVEKPFCEIKIDGESIIGQIMSKRGELLKIKVDKKIKLININDISELSII